MRDDPHRPRSHFLPPANWMNDPNGLIQWGETYHLFYQYNPYDPIHAAIHWGHATSHDLVHWQYAPIALIPDVSGPDADGCWSGCVVDDNGIPTLVYSGHRDGHQRPCLAISTDGLQTWQKYPGNPVIAAAPPDLDLIGFRDHSVWREGDVWHMLIGGGLRAQGGVVLRYRSRDLRAWEYCGPLLVGDARHADPVWTGAMWECPDFFALQDRHVLLVSAWDSLPYHSLAFVGRYQNEQFTPEVVHKLDYGDQHFYAPQSLRDSQGRRIVFGWAMEGRDMAAQQAAGWAGVLSLPRELRIGADGRVAMLPIHELALLRGAHVSWRGLTVRPGEPIALLNVAGAALELALELGPSASGGSGLVLRRSPDGAEETRIIYQPEAGELMIDRSRSSLSPGVARDAHIAPLQLAAGEPLRLRVFLDHSILEVFANDRVAITTRIYPTRADSLGIALVAEHSGMWLIALDAWEINPIW